MKANEVHKLSDEELGIEAERIRRRLFDLRTQSVTEKLENPQQLGNLRRDVARILTVQRQRELGKKA